MKRKKWISLLLAAMMLLGPGAPALAEEESGDALPDAVEVPAEPVSAPEEQALDVTLALDGAVEGVEKILYYSPDGTLRQARQDGIYSLASPEAEPVLTESAGGLKTTLPLAPEQEFTVTLAAGYDAWVENGAIVSGDALSGLRMRAPAEGTVSVTVTAAPAGDETAPEPAAISETGESSAPIMTIAAAQDVTVDLSGTLEAIHRVIYQGTEELVYFTDSTGTYYEQLDSAGNNETVYVTHTDGIQTHLTPIANGEERAAMGFDLRIFLENECDVTVTGATVESNEMDVGGRCVDILLPDSGAVTIAVAAYDGEIPTAIPYTFYNEDWDNGVVVGGGSVAEGSAAGKPYAHPEDGTVVTGGNFEVWTGPGYEIQVVEGGSVVETKAPYGPAAADVPEGSTCYVLHVELGAEKFAIAAVKQGETFTPPGPFKDVTAGSWFKDVVEKAYAAGVVTGVSADMFSPNTAASRGQTVTMIWRQAGSPEAAASAFGDLSADYYKGAVAWASYIGAVNGTSSTSFSPNSCITREQLAAILYRMAGSPAAYSGGLLSNYSDAGAVNSYARSAMQWALDYGIINGYSDGTLRPGYAATRAEVCAMLMRYNELVGCFPTEPVASPAQSETQTQTETQAQSMSSAAGRNLDNPKLIRPKRDKIDDGLYDNGEDGGQWIQQWSETYWDLDRSGEDIMWCTRNLTRIYSGPGVDYDVVYTLYSTYEVSRLGPDENGWTQVVYHEYETGSGFTGWDYTGYVRTEYLSKVVPCHPHVADFSSGPALEKWCHTGIPEGDLYADYGASANGTFYHEAYDPAVSGDTYTYTLRGGGHVIIHNVLPEGLVSVEASGELETHSILLFVGLEKGYGIRASKGYGGGYILSCSGDYLSCEVDYEMEVSTDEDIELTMFYGDGAPRVLQATLKDPLGGSRMGDGASRFLFLDDSGSVASYHMAENFFNLKGGYKLKSLSPYATVGKVENNELHHFTVQNLPEGIDQIWFEVVRG